jgi:hypothetical protein
MEYPYHAAAKDVKINTVYKAPVSPGWACWATVWQDCDDALYVSFQELRRGENLLWEPVPADFWESMGLPHGYHETLCNGAKDIVSEFVLLKSVDSGLSWTEISRTPSKMTVTFSWASLPGGRIVRSISNDYIAWHPGDRQETWSEISYDGGKTWTRQSTIVECHNGSPYRLRRLKDGTLVQLLSVATPFGPGRERFKRISNRQNVKQEFSICLYFSKDEGSTWAGPCVVLPGIYAWEPDFLELPSGDILILNSTVQGGPQVRQYIRKGPWGWMPGPVFDVVSGRVPECLVYANGIITGAVRLGEFSCSDDEGATWHRIEGLPVCGYQPFATVLPDGRLFFVWHDGGGDEDFGKKDLNIGSAVFRLDADLPKLPVMTLEREMNDEKTKYINSYVVSLKTGNIPLSDKHISFKYKKRYTENWIESAAITDCRGQARLDLNEIFKDEKNIHMGYEVTAAFLPFGKGSDITITESYYSYAITSTKADLGW